MYSVCQQIYEGVSKSLNENTNVSFDKTLKSITAVAQSSPPNSPNSVLYEDAETVVTMDDAINGEGAPPSAYTKITAALNQLQAHLRRYQHLVHSRS